MLNTIRYDTYKSINIDGLEEVEVRWDTPWFC